MINPTIYSKEINTFETMGWLVIQAANDKTFIAIKHKLKPTIVKGKREWTFWLRYWRLLTSNRSKLDLFRNFCCPEWLLTPSHGSPRARAILFVLIKRSVAQFRIYERSENKLALKRPDSRVFADIKGIMSVLFSALRKRIKRAVSNTVELEFNAACTFLFGQ